MYRMVEKDSDFWNKIAHNYDSQVNSKYAHTYKSTINITKKFLNVDDIVLDYACGTGITTIELSKKVKKIYAIDRSRNMISIAQNKAIKNSITNITFTVGDIFDNHHKKNTFNAIMAFNILYFIKDVEKLLKRIHDLLAPDGLFISATDCLGEKKTILSIFQILLSKIGLLPYIKAYTKIKIREIIEENNFSILETHNLYDSPPNYYIVAKKI
jgi:ubiquinone/menaquinone biosynthesis C-methylase UbiE